MLSTPKSFTSIAATLEVIIDQMVDLAEASCRQPFIFRCEDVREYAEERNGSKNHTRKVERLNCDWKVKR